MYKSYFENIQSNIHSNRYDILDSTQGKYSTFVTPKDYIVEKPKGDGTLNEKKSKSYSISINDFISKEVEYKDSLYVFAKEKLQNIYGNLN
jgi:hypothetical protein